jgi:hypothetical protein
MAPEWQALRRRSVGKPDDEATARCISLDRQDEFTRPYGKEGVMADANDPTGVRGDALDAFLEAKLREGFEVETHTDTHAIVVERNRRKSLLSRLRGRSATNRYVVSVDEHGEVAMIPAEPKRS